MKKHPRILGWTGFLVVVAVVVVAVVWVRRSHKEVEAASKEVARERQHAQAAEKQARAEGARAEAARRQTAKERTEARAEVNAARHAADDAKAVVAFLRDKLLSVGREAGWADGYWLGPQQKEVTLRKALDAAAGEVAKAFPDRPLVEAAVREVLGAGYLDRGEQNLAIAQYQKALALREAMLGPDAPETVACRDMLARAERVAGRTTEAARLYERNPDTVSHARALAIRGAVLLSEKKAAEAEGKFRESLDILQRLRPHEWATFKEKSQLGEALLDQKKYAEAEPLLLSGYRGLHKRQASIPQTDRGSIKTALERVVRLYDAWGKKAEADKWRKELETAR